MTISCTHLSSYTAYVYIFLVYGIYTLAVLTRETLWYYWFSPDRFLRYPHRHFNCHVHTHTHTHTWFKLYWNWKVVYCGCWRRYPPNIIFGILAFSNDFPHSNSICINHCRFLHYVWLYLLHNYSTQMIASSSTVLFFCVCSKFKCRFGFVNKRVS